MSDTNYSAPAAIAVEDRLYRALAVLRVVVTVNAVGLNIFRRDNFDHPNWAVVVIGCMLAWTAFAIWAYAERSRRVLALLVADLALAATALLLTPLVKGEGFNATIPGYWVMVVVLAWALHWRWVGGLIASTVITVSDVSIRSDFSQTNYGNLFLLMIGGPIVGYMTQQVQRMAVERDRAERAAAAADERARLARVVHDGVLQVLALVQRRGAEIGGETAELGRLAGEQEVALRTLIRRHDAGLRELPEAVTLDLAEQLDLLEGHRPPHVNVATPGTSVVVPAHVGTELLAVARACLDNVARHVGEDASAWVLLEDLGDTVVVTVRDDGPGIPSGRLEQAARDGRLGVAESIQGRMRDLGGTADLSTGSFGTEWELTVPR
ncbi:MacS family sensor histidine kinase [Nocardioides speluncae]|uniref:MacS family sensor histidine kinase n=1 Tax=Nocardioides speluncae TaxID=2670337 RepID=UPI001F0BF4FA|nr:DUF5931 domain-containing protein [Nocardioides speluncae]